MIILKAMNVYLIAVFSIDYMCIILFGLETVQYCGMVNNRRRDVESSMHSPTPLQTIVCYKISTGNNGGFYMCELFENRR